MTTSDSEAVAWHVTVSDTARLRPIAPGSSVTIDDDRCVVQSSARAAIARWIASSTGMGEADALGMLVDDDQMRQHGRFIIYAAALTLADMAGRDDDGEDL